MALFGFGKKNEKKAPKAEKSSGDSKARSVKLEAGSKKKLQLSTSKIAVATTAKDVLLRPRITEKAANMGSESVYTFDVRAGATKREIAVAVKALYKVTPIKVNVVTIPAKRVAMRKRRGFGKTAGGKKAYVFLKKGAQIQLT